MNSNGGVVVSASSSSGATATTQQQQTSSSSSTMSGATLKTYFKTHEGRYNLHYEKPHPSSSSSSLLHYSHSTKTLTRVSLARLKERQVPTTLAGQSSGSGAHGVVRSAAMRLLGGSSGSRALSFVGGNGSSKSLGGNGRIGLMCASSSSNQEANSNFDGKGAYLIFNVGDAIFISDLNSEDKDPIKSIHFSNSNPTCHAFDQDCKDGHDMLIGLNTGDVYSVSLRQQLQDVGKKIVGAQHYNKDGSINNSRCTCLAWVRGGDGAFIVAHADGNLYVYEKSKDDFGESSFPIIKDQTQFSVAHARHSKSNPTARWHICQGSINSISFSTDGAYLASVGRDGYLRVFDYSKEQLICGGKSYYGALLCCAWSMDGKYILTGGEDDLVHVWSMDDCKVVAWGEGHNSWVSGVAFDSYWSSPNSNDDGEAVRYRFGSIGQDTQLLLWDLEMDELVVPLRRPPGGSPTYSTGSQSPPWDKVIPLGTLQPAPSMQDVPKLSPLVSHRVYTEPLSGLIFTQESVLTASRDGHIKIWMRPVASESQSSNSEILLATSLKEKPLVSSKIINSSYQK